MYMRLVSRRLRPGFWNEFESYFNERYVPGTQDTPGLRERQLLRSTENPDEAMSLSYWDSLEDLISYEQSPVRRELVQGFDDFYPGLAYTSGDYWVKHFQVIHSSGQ